MGDHKQRDATGDTIRASLPRKAPTVCSEALTFSFLHGSGYLAASASLSRSARHPRMVMSRLRVAYLPSDSFLSPLAERLSWQRPTGSPQTSQTSPFLDLTQAT